MHGTPATAIRIEAVPHSRVVGIDLTNVPFSSVFSDHMLIAEFRAGAWREPMIRPYGRLELPPNITALQYGLSVFEGLKAHRSEHGDVLLFRPWENARRINRSAARLAMPEVPEHLFLAGLRELIRLDERWVPPAGAGALYIRPCVFSVDESLRVKPADTYLFVVITCPFGAYYSTPLDVLITERYVRAFPGGTGDVKPAGNYAPTMLAEQEARAQGYDTVMWLDGKEPRHVEEVGGMNIVFVANDLAVTARLDRPVGPSCAPASVPPQPPHLTNRAA